MNEFEFIVRCLAGLPHTGEGLLLGAGDDCAVMVGNAHRDWIVSTDSVQEGVHFRRDWLSFAAIGRRALGAAVSDIAAMGGRPRFVVIALGIPSDMISTDAQAVMQGLTTAATQYHMIVIGGDTTRTSHDLSITLTVIGEIPHGGGVYRRGARVGDVVYVTGSLGGSLTGLQQLQNKIKMGIAVTRHLQPEPRIAAGKWLSETGCVTSMIDVSDGLLQDLGHVAFQSQVGMVLDADAIPRWQDSAGSVDLQTACCSGEEYELVFTVDCRRESMFRQLLPAVQQRLGHPITRIGTVIAGSGVIVKNAAGKTVTPTACGYTHSIGKDSA